MQALLFGPLPLTPVPSNTNVQPNRSSDDEPPEDWNSEEDEVDAEDEGGASSDGDQEDDEDDEQDEDKEDEEEKQKRLEIERKKEEGRRRKEAAKREKAAVSVGDSAVTAAHGQQSPRGDSAHSSCQSAGWQDSMAALEDEALVAVFTTGACAALDLKELLFLRERDPMRFLDVTMRIKAQRSKTSEEEEQQVILPELGWVSVLVSAFVQRCASVLCLAWRASDCMKDRDWRRRSGRTCQQRSRQKRASCPRVKPASNAVGSCLACEYASLSTFLSVTTRVAGRARTYACAQ